jgi:site-specific recombinase XerD/uncharacterized protein YdcH (DUF465 family)
MKPLNPIEIWLNNVALAHSDSKETSYKYKNNFQDFCDFMGKTPEEILDDYEASRDREFRKRYSQFLRAYIAQQYNMGLAPNTIRTTTGAVRSFFKYNDLPLGHVPTARLRVLHHNRDLEHKEVIEIIYDSRPRERAFYAVMAQSGLRPNTICHLKYEQIKEDFEKKDNKSYVIHVPEEVAKGKYCSHFTFIGKEAMEYLRTYLPPNMQDDDYIFTKQGTQEPASPRSISGLFLRTVLKFQKKGQMKVNQKERGKPHTIRLYNLRKFFRKFGGHAGDEYVNFWMGHKVNYKAPHIPASDEHYFNKEDVEFHRKIYEEKALPHLRLETATPTETDKKMTELEEKNKKLGRKVAKLSAGIKKYKQMEKHFYQLLGEYNSWDDKLKKERESWSDLIRLQHKQVEAFRDEIEKLRKEKEKLEKKQKKK